MTAAKCAIPAAARFPTPTCPIHIVRTGRQLTRRVVAIVPAPPHTVLQVRRGQPAYGEPKLAGATATIAVVLPPAPASYNRVGLSFEYSPALQVAERQQDQRAGAEFAREFGR